MRASPVFNHHLIQSRMTSGKRKNLLLLIVISLAVIAIPGRLKPVARAIAIDANAQSQPRRRAPELTGGRGWLNTDRPLSLAMLRGKIVLLDFWTYGCINCMHIIPDLEKLEKKYSRQLVIIGVHSGRYENEKDTENIRQIILRYGLAHPVYNDADFAVWRAYNVNAWPTRVLIDPAGNIVGYVPGEGNYEAIDQAINQIAAESRARGELNEQPLTLALERAKYGDLPLAFPGKVVADAKSDRLYIADSSHNRVVVTTLAGKLIDTIGTGWCDRQDGPFDHASFCRPQGMAIDGDSAYVADTENHLIRRIDLKARSVETVAGTGRQSRPAFASGPALKVDLNSPWDVQLIGRELYIAMAGPHQVWKLDLDAKMIGVLAGSGREGRTDGTFANATFGQPSGITTDGKFLYTADSEANVVREIDLQKNEVRTLVGSGSFEFGDQDGHSDEVRLQHPLAVLSYDQKILIADTYNHKIKELDPRKRTVKTILGNGKPGEKDGGSPSFSEPGGLSVANGQLFVADTNNHAIRVVDLSTRQTSTLRIDGLKPPDSTTVADAGENSGPKAEEVLVAPQRLRAGGDGSLVITVELPAGYHLNPAAPQRCAVALEEGSEALTIDPGSNRVMAKDPHFPVRIPLTNLRKGSAKLSVKLTLYYCREDNTGLCRIKTILFRAPVDISEAQDAPRQIELHGRLEAK